MLADRSKKKLVLSKETVRRLSERDLTEARGGMETLITCRYQGFCNTVTCRNICGIVEVETNNC